MATIDGNRNVLAFLDSIGYSEGTSKLGHNNGYDVVVGGTFFTDFSKHPNILVEYAPGQYSSAAGRYQLLGRYWPAYRDELHLLDFSPRSQDLIAIQQIRECRALPALMNGDFLNAVSLCAHIWASFPGAGYKGQREVKIADLQRFYLSAGGLLTPVPVQPSTP